MSSILPDHRPLLSYLAHHWRVFTSCALAGVAIDLTILPYLLRLTPVTQLLASADWQLVLAGFLVIAAGLLLATPRTYDFLRRYRRAAEIPLAQPQRVDIIMVFFITALLFFLHSPQRWSGARSISPPVLAGLYGVGAFVGLWFVVLVLASRIGHARPTTTPPPRFRPYTDEPIRSDQEDLLGRGDFVEGLYRQIEALPFPESFVIAIYGGWGEGKTSVLNLLAQRIEWNPNLILIRFNPWYFPNENALIRNFYDSVEDAVQRRYSLPGLRAFLDRYENLLTFGLGFEAFRIKLRVRENPEELRADLESRLSQLTSRLVLLIDDVDRLQPKETFAVLKLCRLSARVKNTVFVLSLDPTVVRRLIQKAGTDPEYLDKIVQKPIPLPPAEQGAIDRYLLFSDPPTRDQMQQVYRSAIDVLLDELNVQPEVRRAFDERIVSIYQQHLRRFFHTLRHAKRYLNGLQSTLPPIVSEVDVGDAFLLEFIQVFFPHIYQDIWRNRWVYLPAWSEEVMLSSPWGLLAKEDEKHALIKKHIDDLLVEVGERDIVLAVLQDLFFVQIRNAYTHSRTNHSAVADKYRVEKRITHPECFPKYFLLRPRTGELADSEVENLIKSWETAHVGGLTDLVYGDLTRYQQRGKLTELVLRLRVFMRLISETHIPMIVRGLCRMVEQLELPKEMTFFSDYDRVEALLLRLIEDRANEAEIRPLIEEVVERVKQLHFAVLVVLSCHRAAQGSLFRLAENVDLSDLRQVVASRLRAYYIEGDRDIFAERPQREWALILCQWGTDWMTNSGEHRAEVREYVRRLLDRNPGYIAMVLASFIEKWAGRTPSFRLDDFCKLYEPLVFKSLLEKHANRVIAKKEDAEVVELFRQVTGG